MSSLYTITAMAAIRYSSVVRNERSWHLVTDVKFLTSRYVQLIWVCSIIVAIPPLIGFGNYVKDAVNIR